VQPLKLQIFSAGKFQRLKHGSDPETEKTISAGTEIYRLVVIGVMNLDALPTGTAGGR